MTAEQTSTLEPPGEGYWVRDTTHFRAPVSPALWSIFPPLIDGAIAAFASSYGLPFSGMHVRLVDGFPYTQPVLLSDLDEVMDRSRVAEEAMASRRWRREIERWHREQKPALIAANRALQRTSIERVVDDALVAHLDDSLQHALASLTLHFELHGPDQVPIGDLLLRGEEWGIDQRDILQVLRGSSPASVTADAPEDLEWRVITSYDIDGATIGELGGLPDGRTTTDSESADLESALRNRVPRAERATFDDALVDARLAYGLRDDHVGPDFLWPVGLIRRALLEVGRRLRERGHASDPADALLLAPEEVGPALRGDGVEPAELGERRRRRDQRTASPPPVDFGDKVDPPWDLLPPPLARVSRAYWSASSLWYAPVEREPLRGAGVGDAAHVGVARVVTTIEAALRDLQPGEVLVAPFTTPAFSPALLLAGALVVEEGGPLAHAAIAAREIGLPAVIGARDATRILATGDLVEVDPATGVVRVVEHRETVR